MEDDILATLPELSEDLAQKVKDFITDDLGVLDQNDLKLVKETDLVTVLKPIQARKLIQFWNQVQPEISSENIFQKHTVSSSSSTDEAVAPSSSNSSTSSHTLGSAEWDFCFEIPWNSFSKPLLDACEHKKKPEKRHRLELIRIVVDAIHKVCSNPKLKNIEKIAYRIISRYPDSFKDEIDGIVIGSGLESLTAQLMYRSDNIRRGSRKPLPTSPCAEASDDVLTDVDQNYLQTAYFQTSSDENKIDELMKKAYNSIRNDIKKKLMVAEIKQKWPFLFDEMHFFRHMEVLLGDCEIKKKLIENIATGSLLVFKTLEQSSNVRVARMVAEIVQESKQSQNENPKVIGIVKLLACYFNEKSDLFYRCFSGFEGIQEISKDVPKHPFVIVKGESPVRSTMFFVTMEEEAVFKTESFLKAVCYCFCCYYMFDMKYPKDLESTLEFIQRYFARINKQERTAKRSRRSVSPKVIRLANEIMLRHGPTNLIDE